MTASPGAEPGKSEVSEIISQPAAPRGMLVVPSLTGAAGLLRMATTDVGLRHHFRVGIHGEGFKEDQFLAGGVDDENSRVAGTLVVGYTPWEYVEVYAAWLSSSNSNPLIRQHAPELINALGDFLLGAKGRYPVVKGLEVGLDFNLRFLNGVSQASVDLDATNVWVGGIASFDVAKHHPKVPVRAHLNVGYLQDNSRELIDIDAYQPCRPATTGGQPPMGTTCDNLHLVLDYAYGIYPSRVRLALGFDAPLHLGRKVVLTPMLEYHADIATERDAYFEKRATAPVTQTDPDPQTIADNLDGSVMQWLTMGVRLSPLHGLSLDLGLDVGLASPGYAYGPPVTPWNIIFGVTYAYDPLPQVERRTKVVTLTREVMRPPAEGTVRGVVTDSRSKKPLAGAMVRFSCRPATAVATGPHGMFTSFPLPAGPVELEIGREGYRSTRVTATVAAGAETQVEVTLVPSTPPAGKLRGRISDAGGSPVAATLVLTGPTSLEITTAAGSGAFARELPAGTYTVRVTANKFLARERPLEVKAGAEVLLDLTLQRKPRRSLVVLTNDRIRIRRKIHFRRGGAELDPNSSQILDQVVDVLVRNPQIKKVRIEGHTDNTGGRMKNMQLSQDRARAVVAYLVGQGISPARLDAAGYGPTRPIVPNIGARNRARNRRVEFRIVEQ